LINHTAEIGVATFIDSHSWKLFSKAIAVYQTNPRLHVRNKI